MTQESQHQQTDDQTDVVTAPDLDSQATALEQRLLAAQDALTALHEECAAGTEQAADLKQRVVDAQRALAQSQRECTDWIKRARRELAETQRDFDALDLQQILQQHRNALHAIQREFEQTLRDHRRDVAELRREAHEIKSAMALDVSQYRRDIEALRASMTSEFDRGLRLQHATWQTVTRGFARGGGGLGSILGIIGAIVLLLFLFAGAGHLITFLTSLHP
jgi:chromosome segregation ATPase